MADLIKTMLEAIVSVSKKTKLNGPTYSWKRPANRYRIAEALTRNLRASASIPASSSRSSPPASRALMRKSRGISSSAAKAFSTSVFERINTLRRHIVLRSNTRKVLST